MNKQMLVVIVAAVALFAVGVFGAIAMTGGDSDTPMMTMPNGQTMRSDQMDSTGPMHTMDNGSTMTGMDMNP
jgi:hypothetical protein